MISPSGLQFLFLRHFRILNSHTVFMTEGTPWSFLTRWNALTRLSDVLLVEINFNGFKTPVTLFKVRFLLTLEQFVFSVSANFNDLSASLTIR